MGDRVTADSELAPPRAQATRQIYRAGVGGLLFAVLSILAFVAVIHVPVLGALVIWPLLFLAPGWVLLSRLPLRLSLPGRLGIAIVVSVYASAHVANVLATVGGFRATTIALTAAAMLGLTALAAIAGRRSLGRPRLPGPSLARHARRYAWPWLIALIGAVVVGGVLLFSAWRSTPEGWVAGGWNWSDLLVHVAIAESMRNGNFPPQMPYFAGEPLLYHWFADFHAAVAATAARLEMVPVFALSNAFMAGAFVLVVWELTRRLTRDLKVATVAAGLALFGGGMGYLRLPLDLAAGDGSLLELLTTRPYDNIWSDAEPRFRIASVLGTGFLPHRATALGLPGLVAIVLLAHAALGRSAGGVLLAGLLAALIAPIHFYAFPASYLLVLLLVLWRREWRRPTWRRDAVLFLAPAVLALPFIVGPLLQQAGGGTVRFVAGWSEAPFEDGLVDAGFFYLTNLGIPFGLALWAALRPGLPARSFLVLWATSLFLVPNLVVVGSTEFDMNKYFQLMWIAVAILAAWLIRYWPRPLIAAVIALSVLSPAQVALWHLTSPTVAMTRAQEQAGQWVRRNTEPLAMFVTDSFINSPIDLAGRLRLTTFTPYIAYLGYDPATRVAEVESVYCDGDARAREVMERYGAQYVLSSGGLLPCEHPTEFSTSDEFETVYDEQGVRIWRLRQPTQP